jgi:hypothetical protein
MGGGGSSGSERQLQQGYEQKSRQGGEQDLARWAYQQDVEEGGRKRAGTDTVASREGQVAGSCVGSSEDSALVPVSDVLDLPPVRRR